MKLNVDGKTIEFEKSASVTITGDDRKELILDLSDIQYQYKVKDGHGQYFMAGLERTAHRAKGGKIWTSARNMLLAFINGGLSLVVHKGANTPVPAPEDIDQLKDVIESGGTVEFDATTYRNDLRQRRYWTIECSAAIKCRVPDDSIRQEFEKKIDAYIIKQMSERIHSAHKANSVTSTEI